MTAIRFSYYELSLLSFLRESHPEKADDIPFVKERAAAASEAYPEYNSLYTEITGFVQLKLEEDGKL